MKASNFHSHSSFLVLRAVRSASPELRSVFWLALTLWRGNIFVPICFKNVQFGSHALLR